MLDKALEEKEEGAPNHHLLVARIKHSEGFLTHASKTEEKTNYISSILLFSLSLIILLSSFVNLFISTSRMILMIPLPPYIKGPFEKYIRQRSETFRDCPTYFTEQLFHYYLRLIKHVTSNRQLDAYENLLEL